MVRVQRLIDAALWPRLAAGYRKLGRVAAYGEFGLVAVSGGAADRP
jgi:hypothetical protein